RLRGRPGRHAHADAPGRVPRRGHLRPAPAGGERAGIHRADRRRPAERALQGARARPRRSMSALQFELPDRLEAREPAEARGLARDEVRLMVAGKHDRRIAHARFKDLPAFLAPGDLAVVNTSATLPAAVPAQRSDGSRVELHFSTPVPHRVADRWWIVELRVNGGPFLTAREDDVVTVPGGGRRQ